MYKLEGWTPLSARCSRALVSIVLNQWTDGKRCSNHLTVLLGNEGLVATERS